MIESPTKEFTITKTLEAPRDLVFKAWTEADRLEKWWGPKGFKIGIAEFNLQPGGTFHYYMQAGDGPKMWGKFVYQEINTPERLVFINSFSDENAGITRAPFSKTWPLEMLNILKLEEENGKTIMKLKGSTYNATEEEKQTYIDGIPSMELGFSGTFEQLETYLKSL